MSAPSEWSYPIERDPWILGHNTLRIELSAIEKALNALQTRKTAIDRLAIYSINNLWTNWLASMNLHHHQEDNLFFPFYAKRIENFPGKTIEDQHHQLVKLLKDSEEKMKEFGALSTVAVDGSEVAGGGKTINFSKGEPLLNAALSSIISLRSLLFQHLEEEEKYCIPLVRSHFSQSENRSFIAPEMKKMNDFSAGGYFFHMGYDGITQFMNDLGIPAIAYYMGFRPKLNRYNKTYWEPIQAVIEGKPIPEPSAYFCSIQ